MSFLFAIIFSLSYATSFALFSDVPETHENYDAIEYVRENGVVEGYEDGTYKAGNKINRAEFTTIVMRAISDELTGGNCFPDVTDQWFAAPVCSAKEKGLIGGYPDGSFKPGENINFVEAAKIVINAFDVPQVEGDDSVWYKGFVFSLENTNAIPNSIETFDQLLDRGTMAEITYRILAKITNKPSKTYNQLAGIVDTNSNENNNNDDNNPPPATGPGRYANYDDSVFQTAAADGDKIVLYFHADWCPFCRVLDKDINNNLDNIPSGTTILKVDYDSATDLRQKHKITLQHSFAQVDTSGETVQTWLGSNTLNELVAKIQ